MAAPIRPGAATPEDPCRICGAPVTIRHVEAPRRLGESTPRLEEVRKCTSPSCSSNTGTRRLGESV